MADILNQPIAGIKRALGDGETSAEELAGIAIERHRRAGVRLHAYRTWDADQAIAQARAFDAKPASGDPMRPLGGLPVSVKDLYGVKGFPTFAGTKKRLPTDWEHEGFLVRVLREQQAVMMGKTHTVELAFGGLGVNPHWGTPVNPWDAEVDRLPGGSSCGAGVSLWEGSAVIALGSDTAGSIRLPASMTGTVGHKISYGRWPVNGIVPLSSTLDSIGALTRSVEDAAWFFAAVDPGHGNPEQFLAAADLKDLAGVRIGIINARIWSDCQDDIAQCVRIALGELESRGARLIDIDFPQFDAAFDLYAGGMIAAVECSKFVRSCLPDWMDLLHDTVGQRLRDAEQVPDSDYSNALARRHDLMVEADRNLKSVDVLAIPTVPVTPPPMALFDDLDQYMALNRIISLGTNPVNMLNLCSISVPCGLDDSAMPVGLQLIGRHGTDESLLGIALAAEKILGTAIERLGAPPLGTIEA